MLLVFCNICFLIFGSFIIISVDNFDFTTSLTAVMTCVGNVGPGLGGVGPVENFSIFSPFVKWYCVWICFWVD